MWHFKVKRDKDASFADSKMLTTFFAHEDWSLRDDGYHPWLQPFMERMVRSFDAHGFALCHVGVSKGRLLGLVCVNADDIELTKYGWYQINFLCFNETNFPKPETDEMKKLSGSTMLFLVKDKDIGEQLTLHICPFFGKGLSIEIFQESK